MVACQRIIQGRSVSDEERSMLISHGYVVEFRFSINFCDSRSTEIEKNHRENEYGVRVAIRSSSFRQVTIIGMQAKNK